MVSGGRGLGEAEKYQMIEDLAGERPVNRRGQVGQEDGDVAADHAERHEEIIADRREANRPGDARLLPQGMDEAVQVPAERGGQDLGLPYVVFPVDDDGKVATAQLGHRPPQRRASRKEW